jgi:hypothetical protein
MQSSATCQASQFGDWAREDKLLEASVFGFRGWQVNPNLIFGDGEIRLRPQMEVWFCAIAGTHAARHHALITIGRSGANRMRRREPRRSML